MGKKIIKHSLIKSIILHLAPGVLAGAAYYALAPVVSAKGYPTIMALCIAGLFILLPFELGYLFYLKKREGKKLFGGIIQYVKSIPVLQYLIWTLVIILLTGGIFAALSFTTDFSMKFFSWIPDNMILDMGMGGEFTKSKLVVTYTAFFFLIVLAIPIVEELYFRGFLLPGMPAYLRNWSPLLHGLLFAIYHTFTPWLIIVRFVGILPLAYIVRYKKNIYLGIIAHCILNSLDFIAGVIFIISLKG